MCVMHSVDSDGDGNGVDMFACMKTSMLLVCVCTHIAPAGNGGWTR